MLIARPWPSYGPGCPHEACSRDGRTANLGPEIEARRASVWHDVDNDGHAAPLRSSNRSQSGASRGAGRGGECGRRSLVLPCDGCPAPAAVARRDRRRRHDMATAVSEYEAPRPAQRIEGGSQASMRLVLGWCSRSVRGPESGGLVRGGVVAAEALSCHLAQARRKETPSPSLLRALSDNNVFRRRCRSRAQRRRLLHHELDNVLLVDVRASVWLAGRDVCPAAATDPRQAGSAPAT
jgi:hypothetical protein